LLRACNEELSPALYGFKDLSSVSPATKSWAGFPEMQVKYQYADITISERKLNFCTFFK